MPARRCTPDIARSMPEARQTHALANPLFPMALSLQLGAHLGRMTAVVPDEVSNSRQKWMGKDRTSVQPTEYPAPRVLGINRYRKSASHGAPCWARECLTPISD